MDIKKILISGGVGFIGSAVIRHIINNTDHSVINVATSVVGAGSRFH
jgi:dTDP-glucose 4,6-dehydratase